MVNGSDTVLESLVISGKLISLFSFDASSDISEYLANL